MRRIASLAAFLFVLVGLQPAWSQPVINIVAPAPGVCVNNGDEVFEGFIGGEALPDPRDVPLTLEVGSAGGGTVHLVFESNDEILFEADYEVAQAGVNEETDRYVLPGFLVEDAADYTFKVTASVDEQEAEDEVTVRVDREPPRMVVDFDVLDDLAGCHEAPPAVDYEIDDNQDDNPTEDVVQTEDGCDVKLDTGCVQAGSETDVRRTQLGYGFSVGGSWFPMSEWGINFGYSHSTNQLAADGTRRNVFYGPTAQFSAGLVLSLDAIYESMRGTRRGFPFVLVAENEKKRKTPTRGGVDKRLKF